MILTSVTCLAGGSKFNFFQLKQGAPIPLLAYVIKKITSSNRFPNIMLMTQSEDVATTGTVEQLLQEMV